MSQDPTPCERCGTFALLTPSWGRLLCSACLGRRHGVEAEPLTVGNLLKGALALIPELSPAVPVWVVAFAIADATLGFVLGRQFAEWPAMALELALSAATTDLVGAAVAVVALEQIELGRRSPWSVVWARVARRWPSLFLLNATIMLVEGAGTLACCVPGFAISALWLLALPIAMREGRDPWQALQQSWRRVRPVFWSAFGATCVAIVPPIIFGVASVLVSTTDGPTGELLPAVLQALGYISWLPGMVMASVAYAKLSASAGPQQAPEYSEHLLF